MRKSSFIWVPRGEPFLDTGNGSIREFPAILEHMVRQRGLSDGIEMADYLHPRLSHLSDPFEIPEMQAAVERLLQAIDQNQKVCIFGDYDVDGITSITLMRRILRAYGIDSSMFIPKRSSEGYGLSLAAIERCLRENQKPDLLISVDCGTVSVEQTAYLAELGIDLVIVDHHEPLPNQRPTCVALVNPKCGDKFTYLCAAGVVFKLGHALLKTRPVDFNLKEMMDLVAVATISDIVPMIGENRLLVRHGLRRLPNTMNPGLRALQEVTGMNGTASSMDVGFRIGPRLNAAGRMDQPERALEALNTDCRRLAGELAAQLEDFNRERQTLETRIRKEAHAMLAGNFDAEHDAVIVLASRDWHPGVVGIVASRLMRQFHKPTFVISIDEDGVGKGSGRSIEGVSLVEGIRACETDLIIGGGHAMAAGISIREELIDSFRSHFGQWVMEITTEEQRRPKLKYDAELNFESLSLDFLASYDLLQPFGNGNPQPVFVSRGVELSRPPHHMKNHHLRLTLRQGYSEHDSVFFGGGEHALPDPPWDIAFTVDRNTFRGKTTLQLIIQDVRAAQ